MVDFLILSLATWRLSSLLVDEEGPAEIFERLRHWAGIGLDERGHSTVEGGELARALLCIWCTSVWVGILFGALYAVWPGASLALGLPLALSAAALIVKRFV
jgi:hypothetical protein